MLCDQLFCLLWSLLQLIPFMFKIISAHQMLGNAMHAALVHFKRGLIPFSNPVHSSILCFCQQVDGRFIFDSVEIRR